MRISVRPRRRLDGALLIGVVLAACAPASAAEVVMPAADPAPRSAIAQNAGRADCGLDGGVFTHGPRAGQSVALTFDACPTSRHPGFAAEIADFLERERVPATFFVSGRWADAHPRELARLHSVAFFEIALHGDRHHRLLHASAAAIESEMRDGRDALDRLGAAPRPLFRPPYGDRPPALAAIAAQSGITAVTWDVAPGDPVPGESAARLERDVLRAVRSGSIIVLHVNGGGVHTAEALPTLVAELRKRNFRFATVGELLRDCGVGLPATASP